MTVAQETGTLHVIDHNGDNRIVWDKNDPGSVKIAKAAFNEAKDHQRYLAYKVTADGGKGEVISEFDPEAGAIIMSPQVVGG